MKLATSALIAALFASPALAQAPKDYIDEYELVVKSPRAIASPDGHFSLKIEPFPSPKEAKPPDDKRDPGGMYTLSQAGKQLWSRDLPFTLWKGFVCSDGRVVGTAYESDARGSVLRWNQPDSSSLFVFCLDPQGRLAWQQTIPRREDANEATGFFGTPPPAQPFVEYVTLHEPEHEFHVYVTTQPVGAAYQLELWRYQISTGDRLSRSPVEWPKLPRGDYIHPANAESVPGTPLDVVFALHTRTIKDLTRTEGNAIYADSIQETGPAVLLVGAGGEVDWSQTFPGRYDPTGKERRPNLSSPELKLAVTSTEIIIPLTHEQPPIRLTLTRPGRDGKWTAEER